MGMAASQARFLGLTARKTNVEYEGQQINQQRTALANQSANYYNDLLGMSVPTPPSVDAFTKTIYTFNDGALTNTITSMIARTNGEYSVSYVKKWMNDFTPVVAGSAVLTKSTTGNAIYGISYGGTTVGGLGPSGSPHHYYFGNTELRRLWTDATHTQTSTFIENDPYMSTLTTAQINDLYAEEKKYNDLLVEKYGAGVYAVRYEQNTTTGVWSPVFYKVDDIINANYSSNSISQSNIFAYEMGTAEETEEIIGETATLEQDATGRFIKITFTGTGVSYSLTTNTVTDQDAYDDAMNQYEYDKNKYDQAIDDINSKIEIIQIQDKNLELRLKQLDTEQDAISQEMDAVQKVIEKNTEKTFGTFG